MGGEYAPNIVTPGLVQERSADELRTLILEGLPARGMASLAVPEPELTQLLGFYLSLTAPAVKSPVSGGVARGERLFQSKGCVAGIAARPAASRR